MSILDSQPVEEESEVTLIKPSLEQDQSVMKALLGDGTTNEIPRSNLIELSEGMNQAFAEAGAIEPPLDPLSLVRLSGMSATLPTLVRAMAENVHGFGYRFDPVIDFNASDTFDKVKQSMIIESEYRAEEEAGEGEEPKQITEPSDDEVKERIESLKNQSRKELAKLKAFFRNASQVISFSRLGRKIKADEETTGYACLEVRRDGIGRLRRLNYAPSWTFRALKKTEPVEVMVREQLTDISWGEIPEDYRFRPFVQIYEGEVVYFKEFGDPRIMSSKTGKFYKDIKSLEKEEKNTKPATEVIWFNLDNPESDIYGQVKWAGCTPGVMGNREQAEVSLLFWRSKAIPPMVIMVAGGKLASGAKEKIQDILDNELKGVQNFHKIMLLEAIPSPSKGGMASAQPGQNKVSIEIKPLIQAIWSEAIWRGYVQDNKNEQGQAFRFPPFIRGDLERLNRATFKVGKEVVEQQVFQPERKDFSWIIDRTILRDLGVTLWTFKLNSPETAESDQLVEFVRVLVEAMLTVNEGREILGNKVFGKELPPIDADWARMPLKQALAGMLPEDLPEEQTSDDSDKDDEETLEDNVLKIRVPTEQFRQLVVAD